MDATVAFYFLRRCIVVVIVELMGLGSTNFTDVANEMGSQLNTDVASFL